MSISILNRGASGGLTAIIRVNGLSEADTVTASKDGVIKNGVWNSSKNCHEISGIKNTGTWTATATNGTETATQDVLVEVIGLYEIEINYVVNYLMLYDCDMGEAGLTGANTCPDVTGGYNANDFSISDSYDTSSGSPLLNSDSVFCGFTSNTGSARLNGVSSANLIEIGNYKGVLADAILYGSMLDDYCAISFSTTKTNADVNPVLKIGGLLNNSSRRIETKEFATSDTKAYLLIWGLGRNFYDYVQAYHVCLYKEDDWSALCALAGISASSIDALLNNSATLLSSEEAVKHMVGKCTGEFMVKAIKSATFLAAYNASPYKSIIDANKHWAKFLAMVQ